MDGAEQTSALQNDWSNSDRSQSAGLQRDLEALRLLIDRLEAEASIKEAEIDRMRQLRRTIEDTAAAESAGRTLRRTGRTRRCSV